MAEPQVKPAGTAPYAVVLNAHTMPHFREDKAMEKHHLDILLWLLIAILDTRERKSVRVGETLRSHSKLAAGLGL